MTRSIYVIYPERKWLSGDTIERMFLDAVANDEMSHDYIHAHDIDTMAAGLEDMGFITLGRSEEEG